MLRRSVGSSDFFDKFIIIFIIFILSHIYKFDMEIQYKYWSWKLRKKNNKIQKRNLILFFGATMSTMHTQTLVFLISYLSPLFLSRETAEKRNIRRGDEVWQVSKK